VQKHSITGREPKQAQFAALNGWRWVAGGFTFEQLARRGKLRDGFFLLSDATDHPLFFRDSGYPVAVVGQPYDHAGAACAFPDAYQICDPAPLEQLPIIFAGHRYRLPRMTAFPLVRRSLGHSLLRVGVYNFAKHDPKTRSLCVQVPPTERHAPIPLERIAPERWSRLRLGGLPMRAMCWASRKIFNHTNLSIAPRICPYSVLLLGEPR
jgi:hypothetical protein